MAKQKYFPLLGKNIQLLPDIPEQGSDYVPEYNDIADVPEGVTHFRYNGPTTADYVHGYFYEYVEVTPAVVDVETYTIPANTDYIRIDQGGKGVPTGYYYHIPDYKYILDIREQYNNNVLFMLSDFNGDDGNIYQATHEKVLQTGDIVWDKATKEEFTLTEIIPSGYGWNKFQLSNGAVLISDRSSGSAKAIEAYVKETGEILFYSPAFGSCVGISLRQSTYSGTAAVYAYMPYHNYSEFVYRYTDEEVTETVTTVLSQAVYGWRQVNVQPASAEKTKLSEFTDDLGSTPTHTHSQYATSASVTKTVLDIVMQNEDLYSYGIEYDTTISTPTCTRIGNMGLHRELPIQSRMRGCLLSDSGEVVKYLNPTDWTSETRDGSQGQVMVEIPSYYRKFVTSGNKRIVRISEYALKGYHHVATKYVSAYEATIERSHGKLASVVNTSADYRGGNNNADWDDTYRSLLGLPATMLSRTQFRAAARLRDPDSAKWNCYLYDINKDLYWLFAIEYATLNSQADYTAEHTTEGYAKGGLGIGFTSWNGDAWNSFNNYYPLVPCGKTDTLGNGTGYVLHSVVNASGTSLYTGQVPRYRGIENPFGHIWKWSDGINIRINPTVSEVYVCQDPSKFIDNGYTDYTKIGNESRSEGWTKDIILGDNGDIIPTLQGGSSSTYFCDYHWTNIPTSEQLRGLLLGGASNNGANCGFVYANSRDVPSCSWTTIGSRLCFLNE